MHLCFVDESGHPPKPNRIGRRKHFVIAGLILNEDQWSGVAADFQSLKAKPEFRVRGEIKWRFFGADNNDHNNSVGHLSQDRRDSFRDELFSIITKRKSLKIIAGVCHCEMAYRKPFVTCPDDIYSYTYKTVSERFQYYLQDVSRIVGSKQNGIIIADHRSADEDKSLRKFHHGLVDDEAMYVSDYKNYIETVFMTPSHHSVGIQMADMVAGAIGRAFNTDDKRFADALQSSFRARPNGDINGYGLVKFPGGW